MRSGPYGGPRSDEIRPLRTSPYAPAVTEAGTTDAPSTTRLPLEGVKVIDIATLGAGPWLGTRLADFGADVLKVEHPSTGDPMRLLGWFDRDVPLWWKVDARNKRCLTLDLKATRRAADPEAPRP